MFNCTKVKSINRKYHKWNMCPKHFEKYKEISGKCKANYNYSKHHQLL